MPSISIVWILACAFGLALSVKSLIVLGKRSGATGAGWAATAAYFLIAAIDALLGTRAPFHLDYVALGVLTIAFVIAGIRDEPQAEPWYWPQTTGPTGAERRSRSARPK